MAIPDYQTLMLPVLKLAALGETSVPEAADAIAQQFGLSDAERELMLPSGRQRLLHNRIHWAKFYLSKANLVEMPRRGKFIVTDRGKKLLSDNPDRVDNTVLAQYPEFREFHQKDAGGRADEPGDQPQPDQTRTPEEVIDEAFSTLQSALRDELHARLLNASPSFFEGVIVDLLVAMGYGGSHKNASQQLGKSGDGGVDGVVNEDALGLDRVYVQAKRYSLDRSVGRPELQAFTGSLVGLGANKGVFVTTSSFSSQAIEYVGRLPQRVILIDGQRLTGLMLEYDVGVRRSRSLDFKRIDEDYFNGDAA